MVDQRSITITLNAGDPYRFSASGSFVYLNSATYAISVAFDGGAYIPLASGAKIGEVYEAYFTLLSTTTQEVTIVYGDGEYDPGTAAVIGSVTVVQEISDVLTDVTEVSVPATTTSQIMAANADRKEAIIQVASTEGSLVRIGTSGVGAANGLLCEQGVSMVLATSAAIYAYNPSGSAVVVNACELEKA